MCQNLKILLNGFMNIAHKNKKNLDRDYEL